MAGKIENPIAEAMAQANRQAVQEEPQETQATETVEPTQETQSLEQEETTEEASIEESQDANGDDSVEETTNEENPQVEDSASEEETPWWEESEDTQEVTDTVDYSQLSNAIGIEKSDPNSIIEAFNALKEENQKYKEDFEKIDKTTPYANEKIEKANEIAKNGGNWEEYLNISQTDWDLVDDQSLFVGMKLKSVFGDDQEAINDYLSKVSDADLKIQASTIREQLKLQQQDQLRAIQQEAVEKKKAFDTGVRSALDQQGELFGMKLTPALKKEIYDSITTQDFMNSIFYTKDGKVNHGNIIKTAFLTKNINKIMKANMTKYVNQGKGEVLAEASNPKTKTTSGDFAQPQKVTTTPLGDYMSSLKKHGPQ